MRSRSEHESLIDDGTYRDLQLLSEVEENPEVTQRELSLRSGIALGLTNVLIRNLAQKGYLRITQAGWKRWLYNLTPEGLSHKVRLTVNYVHKVLDHYQNVRQTLREELEPLALTVESRVAIYGTGELAELVYLGLKELGIDEIDVFSNQIPDASRFLGIPVQDIASLKSGSYDRIVVAKIGDTKAHLAELKRLDVPTHRIVTFFNNPTPERKS
jgi:ribosomal protein S25